MSQQSRDWDSWPDLLSSFWAKPLLSSRRNVAAFWIVLAGLCALRAYVGLAATSYSSHDAFVALGGAWRMLHGQRPHIDFSSEIGPAAYLPTLLGLRISNFTAQGYGYGQAIVAFGLGAWAYVLGARLTDAPRVALALLIAAVAVSPAQLGVLPFTLSPAMTYNRLGYALLGLVLLECLRPPERHELAGGFSTGASVSLLAFLKGPYCLVALVFLAALPRARKGGRQRLAGLVLGAATVTGAFLSYLGFQLRPVLSNLWLIARARHASFGEPYDWNQIFLDAFLGLVLGFGCSAALPTQEQRAQARALRAAVVTAVCSSIFLVCCSWQTGELPLVAFMLVIAIDAVARVPLTQTSDPRPYRKLYITGSTVFAGITPLSLLLSLGWGVAVKAFAIPRIAPPALPRFNSPVLQSFVPIEGEEDYTIFVNDGINLIQANRRHGESVTSLDFSDPFSYALQIPPAAGGATSLLYEHNFDERHYVAPDRLFGSADLVILPRISSDVGLRETVQRAYGSYLSSHFQFVAQSKDWQLYRRHGPPPAAH